jgi:hypothetical protein
LDEQLGEEVVGSRPEPRDNFATRQRAELMDFATRKIHFKHVYGTAVDAWGVVGFPSTQPARSAGRKYVLGEPVLLAIPMAPEPVHGEALPEEMHGKIFAVCTLASIADTATAEIANQDRVRRFPEVVARWATALPIVRYWVFDQPRDYSTFGNRELRALASNHRGKLIEVPSAIDPEVRTWLNAAPRTEREIDHPARVRQLLDYVDHANRAKA